MGSGLDLAGEAPQVAPQLIGAVLRTSIDGETVAVRLVEVEAYRGTQDPGSHAFAGHRARHASMFGPPGTLYVYRHLGLHHCVNIACEQRGVPAAVLLRGAEVIEGQDTAWRRRRATGVCRTPRDLARGPGRLAVVLGLTTEHDGWRVEPGGPVSLHAGSPVPVKQTGRVGVRGPGGDAASFPWRFYLPDDPHVSAYRAG